MIGKQHAGNRICCLVFLVVKQHLMHRYDWPNAAGFLPDHHCRVEISMGHLLFFGVSVEVKMVIFYTEFSKL